MDDEEDGYEDEEGEEDESGGGEMMTRAEKEGRGKERERERGRKRGRERGNVKDENIDMVPQHVCSCANHSRDHNRLLVRPGAFKALAGSSTHKNLFDGETLWSVFQDGSNET